MLAITKKIQKLDRDVIVISQDLYSAREHLAWAHAQGIPA